MVAENRRSRESAGLSGEIFGGDEFDLLHEE
jgi:hypothetical protein